MYFCGGVVVVVCGFRSTESLWSDPGGGFSFNLKAGESCLCRKQMHELYLAGPSLEGAGVRLLRRKFEAASG